MNTHFDEKRKKLLRCFDDGEREEEEEETEAFSS